MLKEIVLPWETSRMALACQYGTAVGFRSVESVDLAIVSTEATFVAEVGVFAAWDLTNM